jgi:HK97 gp10 family phage protein
VGKRYRGKGYNIEWFGDDLARTVDRHNDAAMFAGGQVLKRAAQQRTPVSSGALRQSAYVQTDSRTDYCKGPRDRRRMFRKRGAGGVLVAFAAFYANMIEESGAQRHRAPRKGARPMRLPGIGLRSVVAHPGMRARPFLGPALEASREEIARAFVGEMASAIAGALPNAD